MSNNSDRKINKTLSKRVRENKNILSYDFFHRSGIYFAGPSGQSVPAQVSQTADGIFKADFVPRSVGEHRVSVTVKDQPTAGSPYAAKVKRNVFFCENYTSSTPGPTIMHVVQDGVVSYKVTLYNLLQQSTGLRRWSDKSEKR